MVTMMWIRASCGVMLAMGNALGVLRIVDLWPNLGSVTGRRKPLGNIQSMI